MEIVQKLITHWTNICNNKQTKSIPRKVKLGPLASGLGWERFDASLPLSSGLINVAVECLNGCGETWLARAPLALAFKIVAGRRLERAVRRRIARAAHSLRLRHVKSLSTKECPETLQYAQT